MKDFDSEIQQKESKIEENKAEMVNIYDKFMKGMVYFFKQWYIDESKNIVVNNSEIALKLSEDQLRELKNSVNVLAEDAQNMVRENLDLEELWWHKKENNLIYTNYISSLPDFLQARLENIAGKLGSVFEMHGFFTIPSANMRNNTVDFVRKDQEISFKRNLVISKSLRDIYDEYVKLVDATKLHKYDLQNLNTKKKENNIGDVWDSL